jgi:hypothetical protein
MFQDVIHNIEIIIFGFYISRLELTDWEHYFISFFILTGYFRNWCSTHTTFFVSKNNETIV